MAYKRIGQIMALMSLLVASAFAQDVCGKGPQQWINQYRKANVYKGGLPTDLVWSDDLAAKAADKLAKAHTYYTKDVCVALWDTDTLWYAGLGEDATNCGNAAPAWSQGLGHASTAYRFSYPEDPESQRGKKTLQSTEITSIGCASMANLSEDGLQCLSVVCVTDKKVVPFEYRIFYASRADTPDGRAQLIKPNQDSEKRNQFLAVPHLGTPSERFPGDTRDECPSFALNGLCNDMITAWDMDNNNDSGLSKYTCSGSCSPDNLNTLRAKYQSQASARRMMASSRRMMAAPMQMAVA